MNQTEQSYTPEELKNLESDPVWSLLDEASSHQASPSFANSIIAEIKADATDNIVTHASFWKRYFIPISATAAASLAACIILTFNTSDLPNIDSSNIANINAKTAQPPELFPSDADLVLIEDNQAATPLSEIDQLAAQMIEIDNEDPFIMTADDINVLVSM